MLTVIGILSVVGGALAFKAYRVSGAFFVQQWHLLLHNVQ